MTAPPRTPFFTSREWNAAEVLDRFPCGKSKPIEVRFRVTRLKADLGHIIAQEQEDCIAFLFRLDYRYTRNQRAFWNTLGHENAHIVIFLHHSHVLIDEEEVCNIAGRIMERLYEVLHLRRMSRTTRGGH